MYMIPAGEYLIIDPCYVVQNARWPQIVDAFYAREGEHAYITDPKTGMQFAMSSTYHGDGIYLDAEGYEYGVDSGTLGCLPVAMISKRMLATLAKQRGCCSGRRVTFTEPVPFVPCNAKGLICFGPVVIETNPVDDQEEEDETDG